MRSDHILEMLTTNREFLRRKSDTALSNLAMLHSSLDDVTDEPVVISLALNDAIAAMVFRADYIGAIRISQAIVDRYLDSAHLLHIAQHHALIGRCYALLMEYPRAWEHMNMAETIAFDMLESSEDVCRLRADILHDVGMAMVQSGRDMDEAIRCFDKALRILGHEGHSRRRAVCLMAIGNVRFFQKRYEDAQNYYMRSESLLENTDDYYNLSTVLANLGSCHMCMGAYEMAETYHLRALELRKRSGSYGDVAGSYFNLAILYERREEIRRAYDTMMRASDYARLSQARELRIRIMRELEVLSLSLGDADAAERHRQELVEMEAAY